MAYRKLLLGGCAGVLLCPGAAWAQNGLQVDVSGGASVERNPFLQTGSGTSGASVFVQLDPTYRVSDEVSTLVLGASFKVEEYFRRYDLNTSGRLGLDVSRRLSPNTMLRGHLGGRTSRTSALDFFQVPGALAPSTPPAIVIPDVSFAGTRARTTQFEAGVGIDHAINEREQISVDLASNVTRFSRSDQADYRYATATSEYRRKLSEQTQGFVSLRVGSSDYFGRRADDGIIFTPTVGLVTQLSPTLSLEAGAGASFSRAKLAGAGHSSRVVPAARAKLCDRAAAGSSCISFSRESQPTALSGISTVTNLGAVVTRRLNAKDEFSAFASYTLTGRASGPAASEAADLFTAAATYSHDFDRRFAGFVSPSYSRLFDNGTPRRSNPGLRVGLRYRFGGTT